MVGRVGVGERERRVRGWMHANAARADMVGTREGKATIVRGGETPLR